MKVPFNLILMVTLGCNSKCAHCCFACGPEKFGLRLSEEEMLGYIRQAHEYGINSVTFSGGEPMVFSLDLIRPMRLARKLEMYVDLRTNAYWARSYGETFGILEYLKAAGLQRLGLSYDFFHARAISVVNILNALRVSKELSLEVFLDWIGAESRTEVVKVLGVDFPVLRYVGTPIGAGRAAKLDKRHFSCIPIEYLEKDPGYSNHCNSETAPLLTVFPGGYASYHPCCWVNPALIRKIQGDGWIKNLGREMRDSPMVQFLGEHGLGGLIKEGRKRCPELLRPVYGHQCEVCYDLLGTLYREEVETLPWFLEEFGRRNER